MSDLLAATGLVALAVAAFLWSLVLGLFVVGVGLLVLSVALADGKGVSWRRS